MSKSWRTVWVFTRLNTKRFFRDKLAIFFAILFPLIFLFVFGGIFGRNSDVNFSIALLNHSNSETAKAFVDGAKKQKIFKIDDKITTLNQAEEKMRRGQLDGTIVLPQHFGEMKEGQ